jgi:hypothetical protein
LRQQQQLGAKHGRGGSVRNVICASGDPLSVKNEPSIGLVHSEESETGVKDQK